MSLARGSFGLRTVQMHRYNYVIITHKFIILKLDEKNIRPFFLKYVCKKTRTYAFFYPGSLEKNCMRPHVKYIFCTMAFKSRVKY